MSKAVLVVYMPDSCEECDFHNYHFCNVTGENIDKNLYDIMEDNKPSTCPLKELPKRRYYGREYFNGDVKGWNDCLKEIVGGVVNEE